LTEIVDAGIMRKIIKNEVQEEYTGWMLVEMGGQRLKAPSAISVECPLDSLPKKFDNSKNRPARDLPVTARS
jgi:hypothetical protein